MPKIEEMYAFVAEDTGPDDEGVVAMNAGHVVFPLVGADMAMVEKLRPIAKDIFSTDWEESQATTLHPEGGPRRRMMAIACKICIITKGIRGSDKESFFETQEELNDHLEKVHHMPVCREGETSEECIKRFIEKYPEARTCSECIEAGAKWTK